jgi:hypothetical protein
VLQILEFSYKEQQKQRTFCFSIIHLLQGTTCSELLAGKPEGRRSLRRYRRGWQENIKMDLEEIGREVVD